MEGMLGLLAVGGLGISLLMLLVAQIYEYPNKFKEVRRKNRLLLILRDYEEQVEGLVRWLQFRCWWLEGPVELAIALESSQDDTLSLLTRLQRKSYPFQLVLVDSEEDILLRGESQIVKLAKDDPIPWRELKQILAGCSRQVA